jgi:hypothetical protein
MDLALAGALSGAGNAGTAALQQVGQFAGQDFLMQEREKLETARLQLQEQYAKGRQEAGFTHEKGLLTQREAGDTARQQRAQDFEAGQAQSKAGVELTKGAQERTSLEGIHAADRTSKEGMASAELGVKERLGMKELEMKKTYYDALLGVRRGAAGGRAGAESAVDKKQKEYLESVVKPLIENLYKQMELATPEEKADIQSRIDQVQQEARNVANLSTPEAPAPGQIKDRFAKPTVPGGR